MEALIIALIERIISNVGLSLIWIFTASYIVYIVYKTKLYGLLIIMVGVVPSILFQVSRVFQPWWDVGPYDVFYSRVAAMSLALSIFLSMKMMYREWKKRWT